jgi:hypothetical protein
MLEWSDIGISPISESADSGLSTQLCIYRPTVHLLAANAQLRVLLLALLRIRIEKMRMRIQEKISMRIRVQMRMRIHALTELWRAK